jgi:hypothetical protein
VLSKLGWGWRETGIVLVFALIAGAIWYHPRIIDDKPLRIPCRSHVRHLALGMLMYAQDYDKRLPNALSWATGLKPYVQAEWAFHCPDDMRPGSQPHDVTGRAVGPRSYDMPQRWSYQLLPPDAKGGAAMIVLYEIGDEGLACRHEGGMYVGFADAHASWVAQRPGLDRMILGGVYEARPLDDPGALHH